MSKAAVARLESLLGERVLGKSDFRGDDEIVIAPKDWLEVAQLLRDDEALAFDHFCDLTAIDFPEREPDGPRFDVVLLLRSIGNAKRIRIRTSVADGEKIATVSEVWPGANWAEREVYDMFGIRFEDHPDLRRILMYEEFEGYPLRKDYPIDRVQPLVPYRDVPEVRKLAPFGIEEGQPFGRVRWEDRLAGQDTQVSPAIGFQTGQRRALSDSEIAEEQQQKLSAEAGATPEAGE
jgi:NADH-quinone oxidoreductase subunit C